MKKLVVTAVLAMGVGLSSTASAAFLKDLSGARAASGQIETSSSLFQRVDFFTSKKKFKKKKTFGSPGFVPKKKFKTKKTFGATGGFVSPGLKKKKFVKKKSFGATGGFVSPGFGTSSDFAAKKKFGTKGAFVGGPGLALKKKKTFKKADGFGSTSDFATKKKLGATGTFIGGPTVGFKKKKAFKFKK